MFERFTLQARDVVTLAITESRDLRHCWIGTEHLLLGLLGRKDTLAAAALAGFGLDRDGVRAALVRMLGPALPDAAALETIGIDLDEVRRKVEETFGPGALERAAWRHSCGRPGPRGHPFTPRAKKVFELALRESIRLRSPSVGPEHVLLGLLREGEGLAAKILVQAGVDLRRADAAIRRLVQEGFQAHGEAG
jgi:ATP-dependent Clp protease ATP-binding subunit ClpA